MNKKQFFVFAAVLIICSTFAFYQGTQLSSKEEGLLSKTLQPVQIDIVAAAKDSYPVVQIGLGQASYVCDMTNQAFENSPADKRTIIRYQCSTDIRTHN